MNTHRNTSAGLRVEKSPIGFIQGQTRDPRMELESEVNYLKMMLSSANGEIQRLQDSLIDYEKTLVIECSHIESTEHKETTMNTHRTTEEQMNALLQALNCAMLPKLCERVVCKDGFSMSVQETRTQPRVVLEAGYPSDHEPLLFDYEDFTMDRNERTDEGEVVMCYNGVTPQVICQVIKKHGGMGSGDLPQSVVDFIADCEEPLFDGACYFDRTGREHEEEHCPCREYGGSECGACEFDRTGQEPEQ